MTDITKRINPAQTKALAWLIDQGGSGTFDQHGQQITANGKTLGYNREVWVGLRDAGRIEFYPIEPHGGVRVIKADK